jgi:DDE domain
VDETCVKVNGVWRYVYRAVDQHGQVSDVLVSPGRDADAAPDCRPRGRSRSASERTLRPRPLWPHRSDTPIRSALTVVMLGRRLLDRNLETLGF